MVAIGPHGIEESVAGIHLILSLTFVLATCGMKY